MSKNDDIKNLLEKLTFVSNQFTTPLSHIWTTTQLLDMKLDSDVVDIDELKDYLKAVTANCDKIERTINSIVSYCYPPALDYRMLKIEDFVQKFYTQLQEYTEKYNFEFKYKINDQNNEFCLPVSLVEKSLLSLIINALQYNNKSQKKISLKVSQTEKALVFTVKDNGDGIKPENLTKVTEDFFREKNTGYSGLGLGLPQTKKAIEYIGGTLEIKSTLKKGTEITFSIPEKTQTQLRSNTYEYKPSSSNFRTEFSVLYNG